LLLLIFVQNCELYWCFDVGLDLFLGWGPVFGLGL